MKASRGFALPTVLIASIVMLMVLVAALAAASSVTSSVDQQYYDQLSREAAESGAVMAGDCLEQNEYLSSWEGSELRPETNCSGATQSGRSKYVLDDGAMRTRFVVESLEAQPNATNVTIRGIVERVRKSGNLERMASNVARAKISGELSVSKVVFGYWGRYGAFYYTVQLDGTVRAAGYNENGQLGTGNRNNALKPVEPIVPAGVRVDKIFTNFLSVGSSSALISKSGEAYVAGLNQNYGLLGVGSGSTYITSFTKVNLGGEKAVAYAVNSLASYIVTESGKVFASGACSKGSLGNGGSGSDGSGGCSNSSTPVQVQLPSGQYATDKIVTDRYTTYVVTTSGRVYAWGDNNEGQFGNGNVGDAYYTPQLISLFGATEGSKAEQISFDGVTMYVTTKDGRLFGAGLNSENQVKSGTTANQTTFQQMDVNGAGCAGSVVDVKTDQGHVAVLTSNGDVCTAGYNASGELGRGSTATSLGLGKVALPAGVKAKAIYANSLKNNDSGRANNTFIVTEDGSVYGAGANYYGQLGNGNTTNSNQFVKMNLFGPNEPAEFVQSGLGTTIIYTKFGRIYTVGNNGSGQLGDGTTTNSTMPRANRYVNIIQPQIF